MACRRLDIVHGDLPAMIEDCAILHNMALQRQSRSDARPAARRVQEVSASWLLEVTTRAANLPRAPRPQSELT